MFAMEINVNYSIYDVFYHSYVNLMDFDADRLIALFQFVHKSFFVLEGQNDQN